MQPSPPWPDRSPVAADATDTGAAARRRSPGGSRAVVAAIVVGVAAAGAGVAIGGPLVGFVLIGGVVALLASAYLPGVLLGIYLLIGTYKGAISQYTPFDVSVALVGLCVLQVIPVLLDRRPRRISSTALIVWFGVGLLTVFGLLYAPDPDLAVYRVEYFWAFIILPLVPAAIRVGSSRRYLHQFLWTTFAMGLPMVVVGITQVSGTEVLTLFGANTLEVAWTAFLIPIVGLGFIIRRRRWLTLPVLILIPAAFLVAISSGSRSPLLIIAILAAITGVRALLHVRRINLRLLGAAGGVAIAALVLMTVLFPDVPGQSTQRFSLFADFVQNTLSGDLNTATGDTSSGTRVQLFALATQLFADHPIVGVGPGGFEALSPDYLSTIEAEKYPHNSFLQFGAEYGVVGLTIFVAFLALVLARRLPPSSGVTTIRILAAFFFAAGLVSGDVFGDRTSWGMLLMILMIDAGRIGTDEPQPEAVPAGPAEAPPRRLVPSPGAVLPRLGPAFSSRSSRS